VGGASDEGRQHRRRLRLIDLDHQQHQALRAVAHRRTVRRQAFLDQRLADGRRGLRGGRGLVRVAEHRAHHLVQHRDVGVAEHLRQQLRILREARGVRLCAVEESLELDRGGLPRFPVLVDEALGQRAVKGLGLDRPGGQQRVW